MKIDTEGVYTLQYTAEDECGNVTVEERTVSVENISYRTVLYADGTFIINEKSSDIDANIALHGAVTNEYAPFNPNGSTDAEKYIFSSYRTRPWNSQATSIKSVKIGSAISPTSTVYWFYNCRALTSLDLSSFDTSAVTNMHDMFYNCRALTSLDLSSFDTSVVTDMSYMFGGCYVLTSLDLSSFDTSVVTNMSNMFYNCYVLTSLDLSGFDTSAVTDMSYMFGGCQALTTIYASLLFVVTQVTNSSSMFAIMSTNLVGGAGTRWSSSNPTDKTYAHIDGGTSNPGYFTLKAA